MKYRPFDLPTPPKPETRSALDNPAVGLYSDQAFNIVFNSGFSQSFTGETVTETTALGVPAIWAAANVLSNAMASVPLQLFKRTTKGPVKFARNPLYRIVHDQVNSDFLTSFGWRKFMMSRLLLRGRAYTFIERDGGGRVSNLWPLDPDHVTPFRQDFRRKYRYRSPGGHEVVYDVSEIIDLVWMPAADGLSHFDPLQINRNSIGLMIAAERYASIIFQNGGVPPLVLTGAMGSPAAQTRASEDIQAALAAGSNRQRNVLPLPAGFDLKPVGLDPTKTQLLELKQFGITEAARIFNVPPSLLQDLSTGTYSNVEQQDIGFVKHSLSSWVKLWEQELNSKLFQGKDQTSYVEFNLNAMVRGDFNSMMTGLAQAINAGILTPDEARAMLNREGMAGGDRLYLQGAMVPITQAGTKKAKPTPIPPPEDDPDDPQDEDPTDNGDDDADADADAEGDQ